MIIYTTEANGDGYAMKLTSITESSFLNQGSNLPTAINWRVDGDLQDKSITSLNEESISFDLEDVTNG